MALGFRVSLMCLQLVLSLGQLDDTDYVVRANIVSDLKHKARESSCSACRKDYAFQVTVSQTTGFEGELEESTLQAWLNESGRDRAHLDSEIERVSSSYQDPGRVASDVLSVLGIGVLLSAERSHEYQLSGRLRESEHHLVSEIKMRVRVFGEGHWCLARLLSELAQVLMASSQWDEAEACQQRAALALEKKFGQQNPKPLLANVVLADIMAERGRIFEGVKLLKALRPLLEDVLGPEHPETITALQILAIMLSVACQFQEAAEICHRVVDLRSKQLAPAHPMTIRAQLTYITVLGAQGRLEEASNIMHDVELKLQSLLAGDPFTSASLNIIRAGLYRELGDLDVALATINAALDTMNGLGLDTDNRLRLDGLEILASIYGQRLDTPDEERVLRQVLDIRMQNLEQEGKPTRELTAARTKLASNLVRQRKLDEASVIANRVLESGVHSIMDDPNAFASCVSIQADILVHRRQFDEAQKLLKNLLESCRSELGENHVLTLETFCSLGHISNIEGKYDQAQAYYESSLRQIRETGQVGKEAIKSITGLAVALREGGQLARAKELCLEGIDWASKTVGETHILTLKLYKALGLCLIDLGELSEAERIYGTKLKEQSRGTAIEVSVKECMAWLKWDQGHIAESTALLVEVCHSLESESGKEYPDAVKMKANVLHNLLHEEQVSQVTVEEALENIRLKEHIFGADDPSTITSMANLAYACARTRRIDLSNQLYQRLLVQDGNIAKIGPLNRAALLGKIAFHYFINDDLVKAEELEREIVSIRQSVFGRDHVSVLRGLANLASTLQRQGKNQDAEGILREIRTGYAGKITEDPQIIFSSFKASISLGAVLYFQKTPEKLPECVQLYLETIQQAQGLGFPSTIVDVWKADLEAVLQEMSAAG
jgi:tetratricopeptide (TPR) repeat protein